MSRVGKQPVRLPDGVKVVVAGGTITVSKASQSLTLKVHPDVMVKVDESSHEVQVNRPSDSREHRALHGLTRALINNMVIGVTQGYERRLEIYGAGYGCNLQGNKLLLNCGFLGRGVGRPAQFEIEVPKGVEVKVDVPAARGNEVPAKLTIRGSDKAVVHRFAADIRRIRPPEPYKGKGIRYTGEHVRRLPGKAFVGGSR
jgi:large subunit ribosomal protein L6